MPSESSNTGDSASIQQHHELIARADRSSAFYLPPFAHFRHTLEELLDLARTRFHGGDEVVSPETLVAAVQPAKNAIRVEVRNADGELKQLILDHNCRTNSGGTWLNILMGGDTNANIGYENHSGAVAYAATTVTPTASPVWTTNQWAGHICVAQQTASATGILVFAVIKSNTATALTVDQWMVMTYTGGAAATTPAANGVFAILNGQGPAYWLAMTADTATEDIGDTTLASEFTTNFTAAASDTANRIKGTYASASETIGSSDMMQSTLGLVRGVLETLGILDAVAAIVSILRTPGDLSVTLVLPNALSLAVVTPNALSATATTPNALSLLAITPNTLTATRTTPNTLTFVRLA